VRHIREKKKTRKGNTSIKERGKRLELKLYPSIRPPTVIWLKKLFRQHRGNKTQGGASKRGEREGKGKLRRKTSAEERLLDRTGKH